MAPESGGEAAHDAALDRLQELAEHLAAEIAERAPDWCAMAAWARELAVGADARCRKAPPSTSGA